MIPTFISSHTKTKQKKQIAIHMKIALGRFKSLNKNIQQHSRAKNRIITQKRSLGRSA